MSLKVKRVLTHVLCFVLGAVIGAGIYGAVDNIPKKDVSGEFMIESSGGGLVIKDTEANGIKLTSVAIPVAQYADYGISPIAESAQTITATVNPAELSVEWSAAWANGSSSWAQGKQVESYIKLTPGGSYNKTLIVECLQAFGEKIVVTCKLVDDPEIQATVDVHYLKRCEYVEWGITGDNDYEATCSSVINMRWQTNQDSDRGVSKYINNDPMGCGGTPYVGRSNFSIGTLDVTPRYSLKMKSWDIFDTVTTSGQDRDIMQTNGYVAFGEGDDSHFVPFDFSTYDVEHNGIYFSNQFFEDTFKMCYVFETWNPNYGNDSTFRYNAGFVIDFHDRVTSDAEEQHMEICDLVLEFVNEEFGVVSSTYTITFCIDYLQGYGSVTKTLSTDKDKMYF